MAEYSIVGKKTAKPDAIPMATGEAKYAVDISLPGMLHGKVLYSPHPHARILNIDTTKASRLPGVKAVMTAKDTPGKAALFPVGPYPQEADYRVMCTDRVRYVGDAVAAVAAVDEDTAEEALDLIDVQYEPLPALFDPIEAMQPGAIQIHDYAERNIALTHLHEYGDIEKGFGESDYVREDTFKFPLIAVMMPEPHNCVASVDSVSGKVTVWSGSSFHFGYRLVLASVLDVPVHRVKVIPPVTGGGFGSRGTWIYPGHLCACIMSKKTGHPVKIVNTREEDFKLRMGMHHTIVRVKTGVKKDGTLVARDATVIWDVGAYKGGIKGPSPSAWGCWFHVPYAIPNLRAEGITVITNRPPIGPFRSYGNFQPLWASSLQLDLIAKDLGIDQEAMRVANAIQPYTTTPLGWTIRSCGLTECIQGAAESIDYKAGEELQEGQGKGLATSMLNFFDWGSPEAPLTASVIVNADGTVELLQLGTDTGSGQNLAIRMIVAEELGIPLDDVKKPPVDTDIHMETPGVSMISIGCMAKAPHRAAAHAKKMILEVVADKLEAHVEDLESKDGRVYVKGSPEKGMPFAEAARLAIAEKGRIVGKGVNVAEAYEHGHDYVNQQFEKFSLAGAANTFSFGASGVEVQVDKETGSVKLCRASHAYDVGFAVNPLAVEGQLQGGAAISIGSMLSEETIMDNGQILNPSYLNYKMLTALDMPRVDPVIVEQTDSHSGPFGAKELGMGCTCAPGGAVVSAIYDATGVAIKEFPVTPERILRALDAREHGAES